MNTNVHIICGKCGCGTMMSYKIEIEVDQGNLNYVIYLNCDNCSTLTGLDELIKRI